MNKKILLVSLFFFLSSCSHEIEYYYTKNDFNIQKDSVKIKEVDGLEKITLNARVAGQLASATFKAFYTEDGVGVNVSVNDSMVFLGNSAPFYDDNVEYIIQSKTNTSGWDNQKTMHVMVTAMNYTYVQKASSEDAWGTSFAKELNVNVGKDFYSQVEITDYGYEVSTFISYRLLNTTKEEALGNITICPAFRNTKNVSSSMFVSYTKYGCKYSSSKTHMVLTENNCFIGEENYE